MKKPRKKIDLVDADDWVAVYLDGVVVHQAHSITERQMLDILGIPYETHDADQEAVEDAGSFPVRIEDVVMKKD